MNTQPSSDHPTSVIDTPPICSQIVEDPVILRQGDLSPQSAEFSAQQIGGHLNSAANRGLTVLEGGTPAPKVAGLVKMSTTDWPGKLAAVIFLQGCPWRCVYCHNDAILDPKAPGTMPWSQVLAFLKKRRGLLDGVVFSGGEPLIDAALPAAIGQVRSLGFEIGLHTGGAWPKRLAALLGLNESKAQHGPVSQAAAHRNSPDRHSVALATLSQNPEKLIDWVGLDIKHLKEEYAKVTGVKVSGKAAFESLEVLLESGVDHEVRTTIDPTVHTHDEVVALIAELKQYRSASGGIVQKHVLQEARANGAAAQHADQLATWRLRHLISAHESEGIAIRAA